MVLFELNFLVSKSNFVNNDFLYTWEEFIIFGWRGFLKKLLIQYYL